MNFLAFALIIVMTTVIASLITNMLRGIIVMLAISSISFYLFIANPEQKLMMDNFSKSMTLSNGSIYVQKLMDNINTFLSFVGISANLPSAMPTLPVPISTTGN